MTWEVVPASNSVMAVYYIALPTDNLVLYSGYLSDHCPMTYVGSMASFAGSQVNGTPLIPLDTHHALLADWVDMETMVRNRPYLDDTIRAAVALVA